MKPGGRGAHVHKLPLKALERLTATKKHAAPLWASGKHVGQSLLFSQVPSPAPPSLISVGKASHLPPGLIGRGKGWGRKKVSSEPRLSNLIMPCCAFMIRIIWLLLFYEPFWV